jgi:hypothetical protein
MYIDYASGNICAYDWHSDTYTFVGNWIQQGYQSAKDFVSKNKNLFERG